MRDLSRLLRPRSIAVLGSVWAENVILQCARMGYQGSVWPVHPSKPLVGGLPAYPSIAALPGVPDATFVGVNRYATLDVVAELAAVGAGGAICFASGWSEAGEPELQARLVAASGNMPMLGPNCYGVINYLDGALLWPDQHGGKRVARGVAILSQSSNIVINMTMQTRGLPVAYVACLGNAAQVGLAEFGTALLADQRVTALGMYVEGIDDAPAFAAMAEAARLAGKGIVCIKSGKTALSQLAAQSHTASLAGGGAASSAFLRQVGVAEVASPSELLETLKILHVHGPGLGRRVCSLSCSGGDAGLVADIGLALGIEFPPPSAAQLDQLGAVLGPLVALANPLDYHTFIWGDGPKTTAVFTAMLAGYDAGVFVIDTPREDRCSAATYDPALAAIISAQATTGKPAFALASMPENFGEVRAEAMMAQGIVPLMGLETGLAAIRAAQTGAGQTGAGQAGAEAGWRPVAVAVVAGSVLVDEAWAKALLAGRGVAVPEGVSAVALADLVPMAAGLRAPLALKGLGFAHKTQAGAVRLGLGTLEGQAEMPDATGYLAEEMVLGAVAEVLLGVRRDEVYGVTLTLGMGGVTAELLADTVTLIWPVNEADVTAGLRRLKLWPMLDGYRGRPLADVAALAAMAVAVGRVVAEDSSIEEIEINPVMVRAAGAGAVAVDALIRKGKT